MGPATFMPMQNTLNGTKATTKKQQNSTHRHTHVVCICKMYRTRNNLPKRKVKCNERKSLCFAWRHRTMATVEISNETKKASRCPFSLSTTPDPGVDPQLRSSDCGISHGMGYAAWPQGVGVFFVGALPSRMTFLSVVLRCSCFEGAAEKLFEGETFKTTTGLEITV